MENLKGKKIVAIPDGAYQRILIGEIIHETKTLFYANMEDGRKFKFSKNSLKRIGVEKNEFPSYYARFCQE